VTRGLDFAPQALGGMEQPHGPVQDVDAARRLTQHPQLGQLAFEHMGIGQELVDRRIEQPDGDRMRRHDLEQVMEVLTLQGQQPVERLLTRLGRIGDDHLDDDRQPLDVVEHALGTRQTDADRAIAARAPRVVRGVGIGQ
jgi:hypothetical protein